jgi:hypothetical protein
MWKDRSRAGEAAIFRGKQLGKQHVFSVKNTLQLRQLQELTPEEHAEGVVDLSPRVERRAGFGP